MSNPPVVDMGGAFEWDWGDLRLRCLRETRRVLGNGGAAEDATQEALIRAWRQRDSCQDPRRPGPWVSTIARREALRLVSCHARDRTLDFACTAAPPPAPSGWDNGTELQTALERLPAEDRWLVFAHYWEDRSCRDLGSALGCPEATVRVRLHRARRRLREALRE
jgi:DNA-directed RNA polymerase specialized sigma24 family protein